MTLQEALSDYEWIHDPWDNNVARIAGPDSKALVMVRDCHNDGFDCWLRSSKSGNPLCRSRHVDTMECVSQAVEALMLFRQKTGDCPICEYPLEVEDDRIVCKCGYTKE